MRMSSTYTPKRKSSSSSSSRSSGKPKKSSKSTTPKKKKTSSTKKKSSSPAKHTPNPSSPGWSDDRSTYWGMEIGPDGRPMAGWGGKPLTGTLPGYNKASPNLPRVMKNRRK